MVLTKDINRNKNMHINNNVLILNFAFLTKKIKIYKMEKNTKKYNSII